MPRRISFLIVAILVCATSCRDSAPSSKAGNSTNGTTYVTTIYSFRAILTPVVGSSGVVRNLLPAGASPHTYEPRPSDVRAASDARALFYGAPELDGWAAALGSAPSVALIDLLPDSLLLDFSETGYDDSRHKHLSGRDPHFWMDPLRVDALLPALVDTLCGFDAGACSSYRRNAASFSKQLRVLHDSVRTLIAPVRGSAVLLSHPFIQYFAEQYDLRMVGVIEEMPGSEPTTRDIQRIIQEMRRSRTAAIVTLPQLPDRAARVVSETVGLPILELDPNGGSRDRETYEMLILHNAHVLRHGLERTE